MASEFFKPIYIKKVMIHPYIKDVFNLIPIVYLVWKDVFNLIPIVYLVWTDVFNLIPIVYLVWIPHFPIMWKVFFEQIWIFIYRIDIVLSPKSKACRQTSAVKEKSPSLYLKITFLLICSFIFSWIGIRNNNFGSRQKFRIHDDPDPQHWYGICKDGPHWTKTTFVMGHG